MRPGAISSTDLRAIQQWMAIKLGSKHCQGNVVGEQVILWELYQLNLVLD